MYYWLNIHSGYYDFERKRKDAGLIEGYTKGDILAYFRERISPASSTRAKLSVHMQSQHITKNTIEQIPNILAEAGVTDLSEDFKTLLASEPSPLISSVEKAVEAELKEHEKAAQASKVLTAIKELHMPSSLGEKKEIFTDANEFRKRMIVGPPSHPAEEYKSLFAKL